jgi:ATP-binding cassette subfamily B protein
VKLVAFYRPFGRKVAVVFAFITVLQGLNLVAPYLHGKVIDYIIAGKGIEQTFLVLALAAVVFLLQNNVIWYLRERYEILNVDFALSRHVRHRTNEKLFSLSIGQHVSEHSGIRQSVITRGENALTTMGNMLLYDVVPIAIEVTLIIGALLYLSTTLGLIVLVGSCLFVASAIYINLKGRKNLDTLEGFYLENGRLQTEMIRNAALVLTNAQGDTMVKEFDAQLEKTQVFGTGFWLWHGKRVAVRNLILTFTRFAVMAAGILFVYRGDFTPGYLVVFWAWSTNALGRIGNIGGLQRRLMSLYASVRRYFAFLDTEPTVKVVQNPVRPERFEGKIEFRNVTLRYPGRQVMDDNEMTTNASTLPEPALVNVNFTIAPGERIAIVGESGAGKSTVVHALLRAQDPDEGQILIDGQDLRVLDLDHYRKAIGVVDQFVPLFDHTLRYNIVFGLNGRRDHVTEEELSLAAEMASIDKFFHRLESGFDTVLGERGIKLSGGERQRVGIARALIKRPAILIFDEATSNLDTENEDLIRRSIEKASHGRTTLIIAHRLSTIQNVDRVIVFDRGRVVGEGTHRELRESSEHYQRLLRHQVEVI